MSAQVTEEDREAAFKVCDRYNADRRAPDGETLIVHIAQAIAEARERENRACEAMLSAKKEKLDTQLKRWEADGRTDATLHYLTGEVCTLYEAADAIKARRAK